jgi:hypothetical protein
MEPFMSLPETTCCGRDMAELASAERTGNAERVHRVTVYRCECGRIIALGESADPGWVSAKALMFVDLRREAFARASLIAAQPSPSSMYGDNSYSLQKQTHPRPPHG